MRWRVFERATADGSATLVFESERAWRRVREYPVNWRELSAQELMRLSWGR